ncbi:MAG TPA: nuclear transport factor 2 family protein [Planctomycetota bacterium]|nr:nuclear transport factor 2 family protein [Planctomycetota bacterium]
MTLTPLETVRSFYNSLEPGRRQVLMELLDPNVRVEVQEGYPGTRRSYVGLKAYLEDFLYAIYGSFEVSLIPEEFLESGAHVVTVGRQKARAVLTGSSVDVPFVHIWTVQQGRLVRARMFTDTAILRDALAGRRAPATSV